MVMLEVGQGSFDFTVIISPHQLSLLRGMRVLEVPSRNNSESQTENLQLGIVQHKIGAVYNSGFVRR